MMPGPHLHWGSDGVRLEAGRLTIRIPARDAVVGAVSDGGGGRYLLAPHPVSCNL